PTVNLVCSATVILGSTASGHWTASDGGSGLSGAASGDVTLVTTPVGQHSASVTKQDNVENETTGSCNYNVVFDWTGFFQPVDNTMLNVAKAGSAIPVKFNLGGNQGLAIFTAGSPGSTQVTCDNQEGQDQIEETVTAGGSSLTYDVTAQQYVYVWKTDKAWATKCRRLDVKLIDGTTHSAYFKFKN
ncbi:MAG TPA: PxKF domain-containing protein, partial [Gemmatimonadales bacterium]|nr:PxKF domain-containing protein [Gemmatimonadales bacterium]